MEYARKFVNFSKFAPQVEADRNWLAKNFPRGIRIEIRERLSMLSFETYQEALEKAKIAEADIKER